MKKLLFYHLLFLISLSVSAQTTEERIESAGKLNFFPLEKVGVLIELNSVEGFSTDFIALEKRDDLYPNTRFDVYNSEGVKAAELAYVENLEQKYLDMINLYAESIIKDHISTPLNKISPDQMNEDQSYFYGKVFLISKTMNNYIFGRVKRNKLMVTLNLGIGVFEHIPGRMIDKTIYKNFNNVIIFQTLPYNSVTNPNIEAYKSSKSKFQNKFNGSLESIKEKFDKKLPKKLSR